MLKAPKSLRLHIGIFGRSNVGKSSLLNLIAGHESAIVSPIAGTTTDAVEKTMELLPIGPVVFIDTAGIDDKGNLGSLRVSKTKKIFEKTEVALLVAQAGVFGKWENELLSEFEKRKIPVMVIFNKADLLKDEEKFKKSLPKGRFNFIFSVASDMSKRDEIVNSVKKFLLSTIDVKNEKHILSDLLPQGGMAVFIIPIDKEAPKGRLILPQVMAIRDLLDANMISLCITEKSWPQVLGKLSHLPDLVVCDSQVADHVVKNAPPSLKCTTFSIIFSGFKGNMIDFANGAAVIETLKPKDKVCILEACTHHPLQDDIGRVKIPNWLEKKAGGKLQIEVFSGRQLPDKLNSYKLTINCGGCMLTGKEMLNRQNEAKELSIPMTNYGMAIGACFGILERLLEPFPEALKAYKQSKLKIKDFNYKN